jgi:DNA primase
MPIAGFIGRRNPHREDDRYAGPKYLNTRATDAFHKSELLYGLAEGTEALEAGAVPVLVEGPMDVIAINVALPGQAVGLAPMGTALTPEQTRLLRRHRIGRHDKVAVATDGDPAGWRAACADFWLLTAEDLDPAVLQLPNGCDPASLVEEDGADALGTLLASRQSLADALVDAALLAADDWADPSSRQRLLSEVSRVIAARPAATWQVSEEQVTNRLRLSPGILIHQILEQSIERDADVVRWTRARLTDARSGPDRRLKGHGFGPCPATSRHTVINEPIALDHPGRELLPRPTVDR